MDTGFSVFLGFEIFITIFAVIENSFLIYVNVKNKFFNSRVYYLIASQSVVDLLTGVIAIPCEVVVVIILLILSTIINFTFLLSL